MFSNTEELLPVISFNSKTSAEEQKKHDNFVERMMEKATHVNRCGCSPSGISGYASHPDPAVFKGSYGAFYRPQAQRQNKSAVNRQRFIRRYQEADKTSGLGCCLQAQHSGRGQG